MHTTSPSLLVRLRDPSCDEAWNRFVALYTPLLYYWNRKAGLDEAYTPDAFQEVLVSLLKVMSSFDYEPGRSFRNWLRIIVTNKVVEFQRHDKVRGKAAAKAASDTLVPDHATGIAETEYQTHILAQALKIMQASRADTLGTTAVALALPAIERAANLSTTEDVPTTSPDELPYGEWKWRFDDLTALIRSRADRYPPGFQVDVSRESIYEGCGE